MKPGNTIVKYLSGTWGSNEKKYLQEIAIKQSSKRFHLVLKKMSVVPSWKTWAPQDCLNTGILLKYLLVMFSSFIAYTMEFQSNNRITWVA